MKRYLFTLAAAALASQAQAQTLTHYWDFESTAEYSGIPTAAVGTPDLSIHATYGEAYAGSSKSLNTVFNVQSYLIGDVHDGTNPTAMDFGTGDFAFSYWSYDDTTDGNTRGPRIFDFLDGTSTGVQIATNASSIYNLRVDTDDGGATLSNTTLTTLVQPADAWTHITANVDRTNNQLEIFFNGVSQGIVPLTSPSAGAVYATRDMDIGVINTDGTSNQVESSALDDLAFYEGLLSAADITALASGSITPLRFADGPGVSYCPGDGITPHTLCPCANNNNGSMGGCDWGDLTFPGGGMLTATGSDSFAANDTLLVATGVSNNFGIFFGASNAVNGGNGNPLNDGLRCAGGGLVRLISPTMASGNQMILPAPVQTLDVGAASGVTRRYQYWFRTPMGPCGQQANLTNGYEIVWMP